MYTPLSIIIIIIISYERQSNIIVKNFKVAIFCLNQPSSKLFRTPLVSIEFIITAKDDS